MPPIRIQDIAAIQTLFETSSSEYRKPVSHARLPREDEVGTTVVTYVAAPGTLQGYVVESESIVTSTSRSIITRNPIAIDAKLGIYNEWVQPADVFLRNYGRLPTSTEFEPFERLATIKAINIDDTVLALLGSTDGKTAQIQIDGSYGSMTVYKGGLLTSAGYGIGVIERDTYRRVS